jgi:hypothetical protein
MEQRCVVHARWAGIMEGSDPYKCSLPINQVAFETSLIRAVVGRKFAKHLSHLDRPYLIG